MFAKWFSDEARVLYPGWSDLHKAIAAGDPIVGRYLDDSAPSGIDVGTVLQAKSLESLQEKASIIKRKQALYHAYISGRCYDDEETRRKNLGCPRLYAQRNNDEDTINTFACVGVFYIPNCPKFSTGECWDKFDQLGLIMK